MGIFYRIFSVLTWMITLPFNMLMAILLSILALALAPVDFILWIFFGKSFVTFQPISEWMLYHLGRVFGTRL
ncbi:TMhelix containing protein [Vibrio phage 1.177.O._10N.286.45.E10]|nr:TMhelix containing protein [Vibrio phage 1.177.O._10N.286.45.E10]